MIYVKDNNGKHGVSYELAAQITMYCGKEHPSKREVAQTCKDFFPGALVYVGGCHVAVHTKGTLEERDFMVVGDRGDW